MSLYRRFFYRRPPVGLLEFLDRVYVFNSCFSTEVLPEGMYRIYLNEIIIELYKEFPDSSFLAFNFWEGENRCQFAEILGQYDVTVLDYPREYEGCPLLPLSFVQRFLRACNAWLSEIPQNVILLHCERGAWPLLAFLLASLLIFRGLSTGERRTLEKLHKAAPERFLQLLSPLNPLPSQLRYLQYVARKNISPEWPPPERALSLDCLILRAIPSFDSQKGCRPSIRIFGRNIHSRGELSTQMLYSMQKKTLRHYHQANCDVIKVDIQCLIQGDVVLECVHLDIEPEREVMMFRIMFNTAFVLSNKLMLNSEDLDCLWNSKDRYPKGFRAEMLFGEVESISPKAPTNILNDEEKGGLPVEAFSRVQELFSDIEFVDGGDDAVLWLLRQPSCPSYAKDNSRMQNDSSEQASFECSPSVFEEKSVHSEDPLILATSTSNGDPASSLHTLLATEISAKSKGHPPLPPPPPPLHFVSKAAPPCPPSPPPPPQPPFRSSITGRHTSSVSQPSPPLPPKLPHVGSISSATSVQGAIHLPSPAPCSQSSKNASRASTPPPQPPPHIWHSVGSTSRPCTPPPHVANRPAARPFPSPPPPTPPALPNHTTTSAPPPPAVGRTSVPRPPPPPPPPSLNHTSSTTSAQTPTPPPPPPPPTVGYTSPPKPPPLPPTGSCRSPPPPPPPGPARISSVPPSSVPKPLVAPPQSKGLHAIPPATFIGRGRTSSAASLGSGRGSLRNTNSPKKNSEKPLHWVKDARSMQGSAFADSQKQDNRSRPLEIDISELEGLFSATNNSDGHNNKGVVDLRIAFKCEMMLSKVKIPFPEIINAVLALDSAALYIDQVENLIKFCPTREEMKKLKSYTGDKEMLGKCEQFFMKLMEVPRIESKLRVFEFKMTFSSQVNDLKCNLNTISAAAREVKESLKLRQIMQSILTLGNVLNQGTARGSAVGFKLVSLRKLSDTRARDNKMTLMHYLCKVLSDKMPELVDFDKDLVHLEAASKIQLKLLAEEMQVVIQRLETVVQELAASENDGVVSSGFRKMLKIFLDNAEADVRSLMSLYSEVGRDADSLCQYFGEDPATFPFEQVTRILVEFTRMFNKSREENSRQLMLTGRNWSKKP